MGRAGGFTPKRLFFEGRPVPNALQANQVVSRFCVCVCVCASSAPLRSDSEAPPAAHRWGRVGGRAGGMRVRLGSVGGGRLHLERPVFRRTSRAKFSRGQSGGQSFFRKFALTNFLGCR